jgi:nucleoside phosphorylase
MLAKVTGSPRAIIFTALTVETAAVVAHLKDVRSVRWGHDVHRLGRFGSGLAWEVLVVETGAENPNAALEAQRALMSFEPAAAIFVGIAGGFDEEGVAELDLVVPQRVDYYQAGKADDSFTFRPRQEHPSQYMVGAAREIARSGSWLARLDPPLEEAPTVHLGPLASGDHVVKSLDSETYKLIRKNLDQAIAVDMESSGFLRATRLEPEVESAVVRGVSDLLDDKDQERDAKRQPEAARRAAAFAYELLATTPPTVLRIRELRVPPTPWGATATWEQETVVAAARETAPPPPTNEGGPAAVAVGIGEELASILDLDRWPRRTENIFFGNPPAISIEFDERLGTALAWAEARVPSPGLEAVLAAVANLAAVLRDFIDVFHAEVETTADGRFVRVEQFYRRYDKPVSEREKLIVEYEKHNLLIKDLAAEITRALNLIDDRIRELEPRYRTAVGAAGILAGADDEFIPVAYGEAERELEAPYPGLSGFQGALATRDGTFGPYRTRDDWPEDALGRLDAALADGDLPAAHHAVFEFAALVAELLPPRVPITVTGGPRGNHTVRFRPVTVRWRSPDGLQRGGPVRHLVRTFVTPRGEVDTRRERLVGAPERGADGEVLEADASVVLEGLRDSDLGPFAAEARQILGQLQSESL